MWKMVGKMVVEELLDKELMNELKFLGIKIGLVILSIRKVVEKKFLKVCGNCLIDSNYESEDFGKSENVFVEECIKLIRESIKSILSVLESLVIFYGVCFDVDCFLLEGVLLSFLIVFLVVFMSKDEVLKMVKKVRGVWFKGFKIKFEVESFV